jgi:hypothetical protein
MTTTERYLLWFAGGLLLVVAVAWIAFHLQREGFAPAVLFPLLVGGVMGFAALAIRRWTLVPRRFAAAATAAAWGLLVVVAQDYIGHRHRLRLYDEQVAGQGTFAALDSPGLAGLRPRFPGHVAAIVRRRPVWWTLDLVLTSGTAGVIVLLGAGQDRTNRRGDRAGP